MGKNLKGQKEVAIKTQPKLGLGLKILLTIIVIGSVIAGVFVALIMAK